MAIETSYTLDTSKIDLFVWIRHYCHATVVRLGEESSLMLLIDNDPPNDELGALIISLNGRLYRKGAPRTNVGECLRFEIVAFSDHCTDLQVWCRNPLAEPFYHQVVSEIARRSLAAAKIEEHLQEAGIPPAPKQSQMAKDNNARGPTENTKQRFAVFSEIKMKHPDWGYDTVASNAREKLQVTDITADTVRNAYRQMGVKWERADRVR